jgi:UDP-N-acetylglucosamine 2-epimerase (hydrolysing)
MGELENSIYVIGSPDMDVMVSEDLPNWEDLKSYYEIPFKQFAISMFHPVTTEVEMMDIYANNYVTALEESNLNFIVIYPNNDKGSDFILNKLLRLQNNPKFKVFPSVRFEAFLVMMKHASFMAGNSSAGIREAPFYGIPTVNVGTRQNGRSNNSDILNTGYGKDEIKNALLKAVNHKIENQHLFGDGKSDEKFFEILSLNSYWETSKQKIFKDY